MIDRFGNPAAFTFLWLIPALLILSFILIRLQNKKVREGLGEKITSFLASSVSTGKRRFKLFLEAAAILFFVMALARPQAGQSRQEVKSEGVEILMLVDVSTSMLAEDVKPSRLELAKKELARFIDLSAGDRVGIIAFAGSAALLSPMTTDRAALKMYIESLSVDSVSTQGSDFRRALEEARSAFSRGGVDPGEEGVVTRVIMIASDGEDNEPGAIEAAQEIAKTGARIFSLGFGTEKGGPIPVRDQRGNLMGYKKDRNNQVIMSTTKGTVLRAIAQAGKGAFHHVTFGGNAIKNVHDEILQLEQSTFDSAEITNYDEVYQGLLFLGLILAMIELLLGERKAAGRIWKGRFEVKES